MPKTIPPKFAITREICCIGTAIKEKMVNNMFNKVNLTSLNQLRKLIIGPNKPNGCHIQPISIRTLDIIEILDIEFQSGDFIIRTL